VKFISLFSGIGGFDLGFERAGMECVAQVEVDKNCLKLLSDKFPKAERYEDVRTVGNNLPAADVICGGFPCQDLSIAGKRKGLDGERSGLWFEFHRILSEIKPAWVVIENVPGLLSSARGRDFAVILSGLADIGYCAAWRVLDAQYFGVAQRRRRVFVVASLGIGSSAEVLFESEGVRWYPPARRETGEEVAGIVGSLSARDYKGVGSQYVNEGKVICMAQGQANAEITEEMSPTLNLNHEQPIVSWTIRSGKEGGGKGYLENKKAMTLGGQPQYVGVRRLTPTECERLQGFPDGWTAGFTDSTRYRMLGNAVAVPCAEWIGKRLKAIGREND
jgi:DNA (cytosine-5)-methyltransferase 1